VSKARKAREFDFVEVPAFTAVRNWKLLGWYIKQARPAGSIEEAFTEGNLIKAVEVGELMVWAMFHKGKLVGVASLMLAGDKIIGPQALVVYTLAAIKQLPAGVFDAGLEQLKVEARRWKAKTVVFRTDNESMVRLLEAKGFSKSYACSMEV